MTLVDTSAWIAFLRADGSAADAAVRRLLERHAAIHTTDTVTAELLAGASGEDDARRLAALVRSLDRCEPPSPFDLERAAELFRAARDGGEPLGSLAACLVAATALRDDLDVLSADPDFQLLSRMAGLRLHGRPADPGEAPSSVAHAPPATASATAAEVDRKPDRAPPTEASGAGAETQRATPSPARVLVVEDEPSALRMLQDTLTRPDRAIHVATTAKEARKRIAEGDPDVIVLDLILPDEDGRHLLADLRRDPKAKDTGVVVVTGKAGPRTREECFGLGADWFFDKPFDAVELSRAVEHVIAEGRTTVPDPDPLSVPLTLSEVQKLLSSQDRHRSDAAPFTVALLELDTDPDGSGAPEAGPPDDPDGASASAPLLPRLLRTVIGSLSAALESNELMARWGVDEIVVVSPSRDESGMRALADQVGALPGVSRYLRSRVRRVGRDEDLLDAVSAMASSMAVPLVDAEDEPSPPSPGSPRAADKEPRGGRPRATLVEDDPVTAGLVRHRLERSGFLVEHHTDGALALAAILEHPPHVVILDVQLPSMDGFEILGRLREDPGAEDTPVLMFTSLGRQEHVQRGFELGADDYVTKPFSPTELLTRVLRLVRRR